MFIALVAQEATMLAAKATKKPVVKAQKAPPADDPLLGKRAPAFTLPTGDGGSVSSKALLGKPYVLYFYPKDDTSGCTAEACDFRDALSDFKKLGATVIGVSKDSVASHAKFAAKYDLNFLLASDAEGKMLEAFGVWVEKSMYGRKYMGIERATFLMDSKGTIRAAWRKVSVPGHVAAVQAALKAL